MSDITQVAIISAMEREIAPLVRGWTEILGRKYRFYEKGHVIAFAGGIGAKAGREAAEAILTFRGPSVVLSVGLAGALVKTMPVGSVLIPTKVVNSESGKGFTIDGKDGVLVTAGSVLSEQDKRELAIRFGAVAVDMEAASIAEVAGVRGVRFAAVKAISDEVDFALPPLNRFIDERGEFQTMKFALHVGIRPRLWPATSKLKRNTEIATAALTEVLAGIQSADDVNKLLVRQQVG